MTNTMNYNDKATQKAAVEAMKHLISTYGESETMDEVYAAVNQQASVSREQFEELYKEAKAQMASWENDNCELNEEDLDMVVGGGVFDWVKDHAKEIAIVAGAVLVCSGLFVAAGFAIASMVAGVSACTLGMAATGAVVGAVLGYELATEGFPSPSEFISNWR